MKFLINHFRHPVIAGMVLIALSTCLRLPGQSYPPAKTQWDTLLNLYNTRQLSDTAYLNKVETIVPSFYTDTSLRKKLELFQQIAWSRPAYRSYRIKYFTFMANNATFTYKAGTSIYYLEKREEEFKKAKPYINSLTLNRLMFFIYGRSTSGYDRCTEEYKKVLPFIQTLPQRIISDSIPRQTCNNALNILRDQADIYSYKHDSLNVHAIYDLTEKIMKSMASKKKLYDASWDECMYSWHMIFYYDKLQKKDIPAAHKMLHTAYTAAINSSSKNVLWKRAVEGDLLRKFTDFFLEQHQNDSAANYLRKMKEVESTGLAEVGDGTAYLLAYGKLKANEGDYKNAYNSITKAFEINDSIIGVKTIDINNNLYAQATAEFNTQALQASELQKHKRNTIIAIVSSLLIVLIAILLYRMKIREGDSKRRIEDLNKATQLQIAELETKAGMIQRKLGMELHDNLSANLAHISHLVEKEILNTPDPQKRIPLNKIGDLCRAAYQTARLKSHEWYRHGLAEEHASFSSNIHKIVNHALPEDLYQKEIEIDDNLLQKVPFQVRIELLRIIQEAIINIMKHSKAALVKIFIYRDESDVVLVIKDNGVGFKTADIRKVKGLGIQSMYARIAELKGNIEIHSSDKGTEIIAAIPQ